MVSGDFVNLNKLPEDIDETPTQEPSLRCKSGVRGEVG